MKHIFLLIIQFFLISLTAQTWSAQDIKFPTTSHGWRIKPVGDSIAWTFGYSIAEADGAWAYTNSENTCQISRDKGKTWESKTFKQEGNDEGFILDIMALNDSIAFLNYYHFVEGTVLYRTIDGGDTWEKNNGGVDGFLDWVHFFDRLHGVSFGDANAEGAFQMNMSNDGGVTWTPSQSTPINAIDSEEYGISSFYTVADSNIWTVTTFGRIFHSANMGLTWDVQEGPSDLLPNVGHIEVDARHNLYLIYYTPTGFSLQRQLKDNSIWEEISPADGDVMFAGLAAVPGTQSLLLNTYEDYQDASTYTTWISYDDGSTWQIIAESGELKFSQLSFSNAETGYSSENPIFGTAPSQYIFTYSGSPITGLLSQQQLPDKISCYPNPASERITVSFQSEQKEDFWILIHDSTGRLMAKKTLNEMNSFDQTIEVGQYTSGQYRVTIASTKGISQTSFIKF